MATFQQEMRSLISTVEGKKKALDEVLLALRKAEMEFNGQAVVTLDDLRHEAANRQRVQTHFERIAQFFVDHDNQSKTIAEIAAAIGGKKASIGNVLYSTHKGMFVSQRVPASRNQVAWKMTDEAFKKVGLRESA